MAKAMNPKYSVFSGSTLRYKLFTLYWLPPEFEPLPYIPDCMGEFSPFLDPMHDDFGRDFTTCFILDKEGNVGIFENDGEINYVPYNILFNVTEYNKCIKLLYANADTYGKIEGLISIENCKGNSLIRKIGILRRFALDEISFKRAIDYLKNGRISSCLETFFLLFNVYFILCFEKKIIHDKFLFWKNSIKYYQNRGVFVFAPHPKYGKLIKLITPNKKIDENIFREANIIGQHVPFSFREIDSIDISYLKKLWLQYNPKKARKD